MLLDELVRCLEVLQGRIRAHPGALQRNEAQTRLALIDPLLRALDWDVSDPSMVTPEYPVENRRVDYALLSPKGTPVAVVEAKKLGTDLTAHRMQMLNYANMAGIPYAALTNGNAWELYEVFRQDSWEKRRILAVSLAAAPASAGALQLLPLWYPNLTADQLLVPASTLNREERPQPQSQPPDSEPVLITEAAAPVTRTKDGRDWTRYDVLVHGETYQNCSKREAIWHVVRTLVGLGSAPEDLQKLEGMRSDSFRVAEGHFEEEQAFVAAVKHQTGKDASRERWYISTSKARTETDRLLYHNGRTYALTHQWGGEVWHRSMRALERSAPDEGAIAHWPTRGQGSDPARP